MSRFLLSDLLAIRADREDYYYGRSALFESHPDLVSILCREAPELISTLFEGLLWHSQVRNLTPNPKPFQTLEPTFEASCGIHNSKITTLHRPIIKARHVGSSNVEQILSLGSRV